jgi:hypothetical protein
MAITDVIWDGLGLVFLISLFTIIGLAVKNKLYVVDRDNGQQELE